MIANPFKPSFGSAPPVLVGRDQELDDFALGLEEGPGSPHRATIFTGARGVGKTIMLSEVSERASSNGWIAADVTAAPGMLQELADQLTARAGELLPTRGRQVTSLTAGGFGIGLAPSDREAVGWRQYMTSLITALNDRGTGVLFTVDEVHTGIAELRRLAATYQHFVREGLDVAIAMAGLPFAVSALLNDDVLTFLRRAHRATLGDVPLDAVAAALLETITENGREISRSALDRAAAATLGYPFLIQLVGFHVWRQHPESTVISSEDVDAGILGARRRLGTTVHEAGLADLSAMDRAFLIAMSDDAGPSRLGEVAARMGVDSNYASQYRARLIDAGIIEPAGHGLVTFTVPYLREYLQEHGASAGLDAPGLDGSADGPA